MTLFVGRIGRRWGGSAVVLGVSESGGKERGNVLVPNPPSTQGPQAH